MEPSAHRAGRTRLAEPARPRRWGVGDPLPRHPDRAFCEGLLAKSAQGSPKGAGQYFTPSELIKAIVDVMRPGPDEEPRPFRRPDRTRS